MTLSDLIALADDEVKAMVLAGLGKADLAALIISEIRRNATLGRPNLQPLAQLMKVEPCTVARKIEAFRIKDQANIDFWKSAQVQDSASESPESCK